MITRRWSQWVFAEYADDDGSLFGGDLLRVVDVRESLETKRLVRDSNAGSWENEGAPTLRAQDRSST